ncbi:MAG TPA: ATP-binding protein [Kineosporiaceae bacterium]|nr:ATP-binding protein [Kineosporiaceae bacterium]
MAVSSVTGPVGAGSLPRDGDFEVVYESGRARVRRWRSRRDPAFTLIVKDPLGEGAGARLQRERSVLARLADVEGVPHLRQAGEGLDPDAIVEEDVGGLTLADSLPRDGWPADRVIELGIGLTRTLAEIHRRGVVHRDLNPPNVVLSADGRPVIVDFDLATTYAQERPAFAHTHDILGTLPYLAPEQTGRTGRAIDHRADLYSLGATLYEALTGSPPFGFGSPLQLVHDQLATVPAPLDEARPGVPAGLCLIVARLLEKEPDARYGSAEGLLHDLRLLRDLLSRGCEADFVPGTCDFPLRLAAPSRLVGRDREVAGLRTMLDAAIAGPGRCLLITGAAGVGKTALAEQLRPLVAGRDGWFVATAFEQSPADGASCGLTGLLRGLGRLLLAEPDPAVAEHRWSRIREALGANVSLLAELPEYLALRDPADAPVPAIHVPAPRSPEPPQVAAPLLPPDADPRRGPAGGPDRLARACADLITAVAGPQLPVVVVLDDLHQAVPADLDLVEALSAESLPAGLAVIGTVRTDAAGADDLLTRLTAWCAQAGTVPALLEPADLSAPALTTLLAAVLKLPSDQVEGLAATVGEVTGGNPADTLELLNALRGDGLIVPGPSGWTWDVEQVRRYTGDRQVGQLLATRIARLPPDTGTTLQALACLGRRADVGLLAAATDVTPEEVLSRLEPALQDGLIGGDAAPGCGAGPQPLAFRHDRVRQAVLAPLVEGRRQDLQLAIARRLAGHRRYADQAGEQYLAVLETRGGPVLVADHPEALTAARLLHTAARSAGGTDPGQARRLLSAASDVLTRLAASGAGTRPEVRAAVEQLQAEVRVDRHATLFQLGRLDAAEALYPAIAAGCPDPLDLVGPACVQIATLTSQSRVREALTLGLDLLAQLGVVPPEDLAGWVLDQWEQVCRWVASAGDGERDRPEPGDPRLLAVARLVHHLVAPAGLADRRLQEWLLLTGQQIWREHGPNPPAIPGAGAVAARLIGSRGDYRTAYRLGELALAVGRVHRYGHATATARYLFAEAVGHWFEPLEDQVGQLRAAREELVRRGDPTHAALTYPPLVCALLDRGPTLDVCAREVDAGLALASRTGSQRVSGELLAYRQLLRALRGETFPVGSFEGADFSEAFHLTDSGVTPAAGAIYRVNRALGAVLLGDPGTAATHLEAARELLSYLPGRWSVALARTLEALALAGRIRAGDPDADPAGLDARRDWLAARAADAPDNVGYLLALVEAERHWALGEPEAAGTAFDRALGRLSACHRPWQEALVAERAGLFLLDRGQVNLSLQVLARARAGYAEWGAAAVVARLERDHPTLRGVVYRYADDHTGGTRRPSTGGPGSFGSRSSARSAGPEGSAGSGGFGLSAYSSSPGASNAIDADAIDLLGVLSASQALGQEQNLDRLRDRIAQVVGDLTGATAVRLLLWSDETRDWYLLGGDPEPAGGRAAEPDPAGGPTGSAGAGLLSLDAAAARGLLPLTAVRVVERTHEPLLVADATRDDRFARDPFLAGAEHCSLMVLPVRSHGTTRAMLVLENRLGRAAFTRDRLDAALLVAGQLAVSLDNALAERFRSLVQRSSDVTLVCGRDGRVGYASAAAAVLFGVPSGQLIGRPVTDLVDPHDRHALLERMWMTTAGSAGSHSPPAGADDGAPAGFGSPAHPGRPLECRVPVPGEGERWVEVTLSDLTADPAVGGLVLLLRDVSERRRLEIELRHAQKMESVGQLAAGVAHEINTPIQFIGDNLTFLGEAFADLCRVLAAFRDAIPVGGGLPPEVAARWAAALGTAEEVELDFLLADVPEALGQTQQGVARVATIVRAMKASAYPSGEQRAQIDLNELVRNTLIVANSEFKYVADVQEELAEIPPIWCFPGDLHQVVLNLVVNAAQAVTEAVSGGAPRGTITVRTWRDGEEVVLEIADTGVGIPPQIAGRVFEQFFTTKPVGVGTGQGLSLAYYLVHDRHHGTIGFTSEPGTGTTFTVRLPIDLEPDADEETGPPASG